MRLSSHANYSIVMVAAVFACTIVLNPKQVKFSMLRIELLACLVPALLAGLSHVTRAARTIYLVDYACFLPTHNCRVPRSTFIEHVHLVPFLDDRCVRFMTRMLDRSGIGNETSLPPGDHYLPPYGSLDDARDEAELVIFSSIDDLLAKTSIAPDVIDILVINCSIFAPVPSLSDMIVNRYKLRSDVRSVNLSGMGCSAGVISVDLAASLLRATPHRHPQGAYALVVSTETITSNFYMGKERPMQLSNILFRMGGAAVLLSTSKDRARFRLDHLVRRITAGTQDISYRCIFQQEDGEGKRGVNLSKELLAVAGNALKANITTLAPLVLPLSEQLLFARSFIVNKLLKGRWAVKPYVPNFLTVFDHFCIHSGGRAVIDEVQHNLGLSNEHVEPSRMTLHRFGNTSSSSIWYELAYIEAKTRMCKGHRVWMIGFGSGFKCNSATWECIQPAKEPAKAWARCIYRYPVSIPDVADNNG